eukprot:Awhi_evm2s2114
MAFYDNPSTIRKLFAGTNNTVNGRDIEPEYGHRYNNRPSNKTSKPLVNNNTKVVKWKERTPQ